MIRSPQISWLGGLWRIGLLVVMVGCSDGMSMRPDAAPMDPDANVEPDASVPVGPCFLKPDGTPCGDLTDSECDHPDMCINGYCFANFEIAGRSCGDHSEDVCDRADTCDGLGNCAPNPILAGTPCSDVPEDPCLAVSTCDGAGACNINFSPPGTVCGYPFEDCREPDSCDGSGGCLINYSIEGTPCGDVAADECSDPDTCDSAGGCLPNHKPAGTLCGDPSDTTCTNPDTCNGSGACEGNHAVDGLACEDCVGGTGLCDGCEGGLCADYCRTRGFVTGLTSNNSAAGAMFDVRALNSMVLASVDANLAPGTHTVEIYYRAGGYRGAETNASAWTLAGQATGVVSVSKDVATPIPVDINLSMQQGEVVGLYITSATGDSHYINGRREGDLYTADTNLEFFEGVGKSYPFGGTFRPRVWSGVLHYDLVPCPPDGYLPDAGVPDAEPPDAAVPDASPSDAALPDAALPDAGVPLPDAALPLPDAALPLPDAALPLPDAALPLPDAALPVPDAALPVPDAALPVPDAAWPDAAPVDAM